MCARVLDISPFAPKKPAPSSEANEKAITPTCPLVSCIHEMPWKSAILLINTDLVLCLADLTSILSIPTSVPRQIFEFVSAFDGILMKFPKAAYYQK